MDWMVALFIGVLIGWLVEWVIDWLYWRQRGHQLAEKYQAELKHLNSLLAQSKMKTADSKAAPSRVIVDGADSQFYTQQITQLQAELQERETINQKYINAVSNLQYQLDQQKTINQTCQNTINELQGQINEYITFRKRSLKRIVELENQLKECKEKTKVKRTLQDIKGIGPVIEGKLNAAGIYTFDDLKKITADELEEIVGKRVRNLVDEEYLIEQAEEFSHEEELEEQND